MWKKPIAREYNLKLGFSSGLAVKNLPAMQETQRCKFDPWVLSQEDPLEEEMATHSSILA